MRYVIVGNGVAGVSAAVELRARDGAAEILMISGENDWFFARTGLMYVFLDQLTVKDLEPYERHLYAEMRIERKRGWVERLDGAERRLELRGGEAVNYDRLLVATGSTARRVPWPGLEQVTDGICHFVSLQDLAECERLAARSRQAVVIGGGLIGIELVECLRHHDVEVDFVIREPWYWPVALTEPEGTVIRERLERHGVRVHFGAEVELFVADSSGRLEGVKVNGRLLPCQMAGITIGVRPAVEWLRGSGVSIGEGILTDDGFRTNVGNVWAAGDCAEVNGLVEPLWYAAKRQGRLAALSMLGERVEYVPPLFFNSAKFFDLEYTTVGRTVGLEARVLRSGDATVRIAVEKGCVAGFTMLGARWDHAVLGDWIRAARTVDEVERDLGKAAFDGEFTRRQWVRVL